MTVLRNRFSWFQVDGSVLACFLVLLSLSLGCGRGPRLVPVTGTVTLDGKPLVFKALYFHPDRASGTEGNGGGGYTDKEGKYYIIANLSGTTRDSRGLQVGKYKVTVTEPTIPITEKDFGPQEKAVETDVPAAAIGALPTPAKREIPAVYASVDTTPLFLEVPENGGELKIELTRKK